MRHPEQINILLVNGSLPDIREPGVLDQELDLEVRKGSTVDRGWRAIDQVTGRPTPPEPGAVLDIVDNQRSGVQDFRKRQPILHPIKTAPHQLQEDPLAGWL